MSREEALNDWLPIIRQMVKGTEVYTEALDMAIKALEQEPCGDAISRQAVDRIINKWLSYPDYELKDEIYDMTKKIHKLPSVTPQPKMGYISIDDVMSVFDDFMRGDADENDTERFLEMLKDKAESEE